jgi:hypothetical protein
MSQEDTIRIHSASADRSENVHEYKDGPSGRVMHRWIREDGSTYTDGRSEWTFATDDFIRQVVCYGNPQEIAWFEKRGYTCEKILGANTSG